VTFDPAANYTFAHRAVDRQRQPDFLTEQRRPATIAQLLLELSLKPIAD
jgi:hypothetical protein